MILEKSYYSTHAFAWDSSFDRAIEDTSYNPKKASRSTVRQWNVKCRELITFWWIKNRIRDHKMGRLGKVVEVEESKLGKKKYNVARVIDGIWILGLVDRSTNEIRLLKCPGNKSAGVLIPIACRKKYDDTGKLLEELGTPVLAFSREGHVWNALHQPTNRRQVGSCNLFFRS